MDMATPPAAATAAEFDVVAALLRGRWWLVAGALLGLLGAIALLSILPPKYTAYLQLVPTEQGGAAVSRNISGLASLAGINLPRGQVSQFAYALEVMKGADIAAVVATDTPLMRRLFPAQWDARAGTWREPRGTLDPVKRTLKTILSMPQPAWHPPGRAELQQMVQKRLVIAEDPKRSVATLSFEDGNPQAARDLLAAIYGAADNHLRGRAIRRTGANIAYLSEKLRSVDLAEHREALASALAEQERVLMTAAATGQAFAADPLGAVTATDLPTSPNPVVALAIGLGLGIGLGAGLALLLAWRRRRA